MKSHKTPKIALSLTGGGARGSYQAGVVLALSEIFRELGLLGQNNPIKYWCGVSAGAINATYCAGGSEDLHASASRLAAIWDEIKPERVYRTDFVSLGKNSMKWIRDLTLGPLLKNRSARALLDTAPLHDLIEKGVFYNQIARNVEDGTIEALCCSAYSYREARTVSFVQSQSNDGWNKPKRYSKNTVIRSHHVLASCAIPILFPSVPILGEYFADGSFRDTAPVSPAIHLGAKKILVVGVQGPMERTGQITDDNPGVARIAGAILNALFFDTLAIDLERLNHLNEIVSAVDTEITTERSEYARLDVKVIQPSQDLSAIALEKIKTLPRAVEYLLAGLGTREETAILASYILFDSAFTRELIELGYQDAKRQKQQLIDWVQETP